MSRLHTPPALCRSTAPTRTTLGRGTQSAHWEQRNLNGMMRSANDPEMISLSSVLKHFLFRDSKHGHHGQDDGMDLENHTMEILTSPEAARYIGVHERTLAAMRSRGDGPSFTRLYQSGRGVRYQRADLDCWLAHRVNAA